MLILHAKYITRASQNWSTTLAVPAHICWHAQQWTVIKLTACGEEVPLRRNVPWLSINWWRLRRWRRWKQQQQQQEPPPPVVTFLTHSWPDRHYLNLDCYHWNPQSLQANIGMETFKPAPTPSPTVLHIIRHFLSWFNYGTHFRERAIVCMGHQFKNREIHFWEIKKQNAFYCTVNEINYAVVHLHILSFIIWYGQTI